MVDGASWPSGASLQVAIAVLELLAEVAPRRPAATIQGQPGPWVGPFHWESRRLRVAELKRLMDFPDRFDVTGTRRSSSCSWGTRCLRPSAGSSLTRLRDELNGSARPQ